MSQDGDPQHVENFARAYTESGKYKKVVSAYLAPDTSGEIIVHKGLDYHFAQPQSGIVDTLTSTHGCFSDFIQAVPVGDEIFGDMDGKGVFLYATRGARAHLYNLFSANDIKLNDIDLLIEHQANFAMIPLTLAQLSDLDAQQTKKMVADLIADKMVTNVHERGNCSVVCMQRLPYDLMRGALKPDSLQGFAINRNLDRLKNARLILHDSVGAGMTRSSFLQRV
jgi:hypothetical protein